LFVFAIVPHCDVTFCVLRHQKGHVIWDAFISHRICLSHICNHVKTYYIKRNTCRLLLMWYLSYWSKMALACWVCHNIANSPFTSEHWTIYSLNSSNVTCIHCSRAYAKRYVTMWNYCKNKQFPASLLKQFSWCLLQTMNYCHAFKLFIYSFISYDIKLRRIRWLEYCICCLLNNIV
jgi:hypothetical protein